MQFLMNFHNISYNIVYVSDYMKIRFTRQILYFSGKIIREAKFWVNLLAKVPYYKTQNQYIK